VLGIIFDEEALLTQVQFEGMYSSPIEAAKLYKNDIYHFVRGNYSDYMANSIIYYMDDTDVQTEDEVNPDTKTVAKKSTK
jgi:hypothetical protein